MRKALLSNGGWLLRIITVTALVAVIALSLIPRFVSHISTSAVVNAPIMVIRSPIEGVVEEYGLATGVPVAQGQNIVVFREVGTDRTQLTDLEARLVISEAAARAVANRIADVEDLRANLLRRQEVYATWHTAILEREVEELEAQVRGATARLAAIEQERTRRETLRSRGSIPERDMTEIVTQYAEQTERVRELSARRDARRLKLQAMNDGVLAGTDGTNTPYTLQRQDEFGLELARLRDELIDHRAEQKAIQEQLIKEREIYRLENRIALASPVSGVVWRSASLTGRPVLPGDEVVEILDCSARFLEAYLPESLMGTVSLGDIAQVRLTGDDRVFQAPVVSILGHGARFDHTELAAQDNAPKVGKMRVLIELSATQLGLDASKFCHVGRTAQVSLPRDLSRLVSLADSLKATMATVSEWISQTAARVRQG